MQTRAQTHASTQVHALKQKDTQKTSDQHTHKKRLGVMNNRDWDQSRKEWVSPHTPEDSYYKTKQRRTKMGKDAQELGL